MTSPVPEPPPEALLIRNARLAAGLRQPEAVALLVARGFRLSASRWSQIETGREGTRDGTRPVSGSPAAVAQMASVVGVSPERLRAVRPDAADVLDEIILQHGAAPGLAAAPAPAPPQRPGDVIQRIMDDPGLTDEEKRGVLALIRGMRAAAGDDAGDGGA